MCPGLEFSAILVRVYATHMGGVLALKFSKNRYDSNQNPMKQNLKLTETKKFSFDTVRIVLTEGVFGFYGYYRVENGRSATLCNIWSKRFLFLYLIPIINFGSVSCLCLQHKWMGLQNLGETSPSIHNSYNTMQNRYKPYAIHVYAKLHSQKLRIKRFTFTRKRQHRIE